jgi:aerobic carbon-monoxide dehydrogenase large subunit
MDRTPAASARRPRIEDDALVRGAGRFIADRPQAGELHAFFVRSPHAFAHIRAVDTERARRASGVRAVLTAADMQAAGVGSVARHPPLAGRGGSKLAMPHRPALAGERVMHVGEPIAVVIADTLVAAQDAAELVTAEYEELRPVTDARAAARAGAPQLWPEAPGNLALDWPGPAGNPDANAHEVERIIAAAAHVARLAASNQRLIGAAMEPRGATASYDAGNDRYTLRACSQSALTLRDNILAIMSWPKERLRVVTEDVGGAFGLKSGAYPEYLALLVAARVTGAPVHWMSTRAEAFLTDNQGRDTFTEAELALDRKGRFLALRVRHLADMGAYIGSVGAHVQTFNFSRCFPGMYDIPHVDVSTRCIFTNTTPTAPYRGAGRPEANYVLERVVEEAARLTGIDPIKLRRRNLVRPTAMPYRTAVGTVYDSGQFEAVLDRALVLSDIDGFKGRRREAVRRGRYRGLGVSCMLEHAGGAPIEGAALTFGDGEIVLGLNVQSTGQGHASVFTRLAAERLGIAADKIRHRHGDSALAIPGFASVASRSAMTAGSAVVKTIDTMLAKGNRIAATVLEAAVGDIGYAQGEFRVVGTDRRVSLFEVASRAAEMNARGELAETLDTKTQAETPPTYPNGCHIAEVEIDPETGAVEIAAYTAVDDCGTVLDPMIVEGQLVGAIAQGLGQALMEAAIYESSGQLVTGSFVDYAMPRAEDMPPIRDALLSVPATTNPLGVKGMGEAGTTAALAAVMNAIANAVPGGGAERVEMPATPQRIWAACQRSD